MVSIEFLQKTMRYTENARSEQDALSIVDNCNQNSVVGNCDLIAFYTNTCTAVVVIAYDGRVPANALKMDGKTKDEAIALTQRVCKEGETEYCDIIFTGCAYPKTIEECYVKNA